ncbi:MAG: tetratricopeptide repeat protein [Planctomycetota bacterium]|nr:tetratricopeptide repeat protein [Planctomycetota bacterium]
MKHLLLFLVIGACSLSAEEENLRDDYAQRASRYYELEDYTRAQQQATRGLEVDPEDGVLNFILGRTFIKKGDLRSVAAARKPLEIAHKALDNHRTAYSLCEYHLRYAEFLQGESTLLAMRASDLPESDAFDRAELETRSKRTRETSQAHLQKALGYIGATLEQQPDWVFALQHQASVYALLNKEVEAFATIAHLCQVLQKSRKHKNQRLLLQELPAPQENQIRRDLLLDIEWEIAARGLAATLHMNQKNWVAADAELTKLLLLDPRRVAEYYNRGLCRQYLGRYALAAADMQVFLGRTPLGIDSLEVDRALTIVANFRSQ